MATVSFQANKVWKKFCSWYGADVLERKYGAQVPDDWCAAIDAVPREQVDRVLVNVRTKYPTWPPGLGEFEQVVRAVNNPVKDDSPSVQERLVAYVLRHRRLSDAQVYTPWRYLYSGRIYSGENFAVVGVEIPSDGKTPGYRVMVEDMGAV